VLIAKASANWYALAQNARASVKTDLKVGICGEHGAIRNRIASVTRWMNYVSCSPYRVPVARLGGAQAALEAEAKAKAEVLRSPQQTKMQSPRACWGVVEVRNRTLTR